MKFAVKKVNAFEHCVCTGLDPDTSLMEFDHYSRFTKAVRHSACTILKGDIIVQEDPPIIIRKDKPNKVFVKVNDWYCCRRPNILPIQQCTGFKEGKPIFDNEDLPQVAYKDLNEIRLGYYILIHKGFYTVIDPVEFQRLYWKFDGLMFL